MMSLTGVVMGNGFNEYSPPNQDPTDPHNRESLQYMRAIQNEHFAAFEQVDRATGANDVVKVANVLDNIEWAAQNKSKVVFCSFWPGPAIGSVGSSDGCAEVHFKKCGMK